MEDFFRKKLSVLIAMLLCVTIGGVYAGWTYFQGGATGANANPRVGMASVSYNGEKGAITADTTSMTILVDDMSTVPDSGVTTKYKAGLHGVGAIKINFTHKEGADADVVTNGIKMQATISVAKVGDRKWNEKEILKVDTTKNVLTLNGGTASKTATIEVKDILDALILCEGAEVILDTKKANDDFAAALSDYQIHVNIVEIA